MNTPSDASSTVRAITDSRLVKQLAVVIALATIALFAHALSSKGSRTQRGSVTAGDSAVEQSLPGRGVAVVEPGGRMSYEIAGNGDAELQQSAGAVFYRVQGGQPFVVVLPGGRRLHANGSSFRVSVDGRAMVLEVFEGRLAVTWRAASGGVETRGLGAGDRYASP